MSNASWPVLSVIVPVFNTSSYLDQCLKSLLAQTLKNIEIICVDNGSTDDSLPILQSYQREHQNIIVMQHPEGRQGAARNAGLRVVRGEYIGFVDSDDYVEADMFERMYRAVKNNSAEIGICNINLFFQKEDKYNVSLPEKWFAMNRFRIDENPVFFRNLTICNKLFKRDLIERNDILFPEDVYHEDQAFVIKALFLAKAISAINSPLYVYRKQRAGSVSVLNDESCFSVFTVMRMVKKFLLEEGLMIQSTKLFQEIETTRYLMLFDSLHRTHKKAYFNRMCACFEGSSVLPPLTVCTQSEYKNYLVIKRYPYLVCSFIFTLKKQFVRLLSIPKLNKAYLALRRSVGTGFSG